MNITIALQSTGLWFAVLKEASHVHGVGATWKEAVMQLLKKAPEFSKWWRFACSWRKRGRRP